MVLLLNRVVVFCKVVFERGIVSKVSEDGVSIRLTFNRIGIAMPIVQVPASRKFLALQLFPQTSIDILMVIPPP